MIQIREYLTAKINKSKIKATDDTIKQIVKEQLIKYGHDCDLNHVDVSEVTYMHSLFSCHYADLGDSYWDLNPDISEWDVRNVTVMGYMFYGCKKFNQDLSNWDVSNVTNMGDMFFNCKSFDQDLSKWDVSIVTDMEYMFYTCENFNQELSKWDVSSVKNMSSMFAYCEKFNQDLSNWDVSNVKTYKGMFNDCPIKEEFKPHFSI